MKNGRECSVRLYGPEIAALTNRLDFEATVHSGFEPDHFHCYCSKNAPNYKLYLELYHQSDEQWDNTLTDYFRIEPAQNVSSTNSSILSDAFSVNSSDNQSVQSAPPRITPPPADASIQTRVSSPAFCPVFNNHSQDVAPIPVTVSPDVNSLVANQEEREPEAVSLIGRIQEAVSNFWNWLMSFFS